MPLALDTPFHWVPQTERPHDVHVAFRVEFHLPAPADVHLDVLGAHWFDLRCDGRFVLEGPYRFEKFHPEYQEATLSLPAGRHVLAALVHNEGVSTRILRGDIIPPFLWMRARTANGPVALSWKAKELTAYRCIDIRINPQLGWPEYVDLAELPRGWREPAFDDSSWQAPVAINPRLGAMGPVRISAVRHFPVEAKVVASGALSGDFEFRTDNLPWGFLSRDLSPSPGTETGIWQRIDLGMVRLVRGKLRVRAPKGARIEIAYAEKLFNGRVAPNCWLACGLAANQHVYISAGGEQEIEALTPLGGRFAEIHVEGAPGEAEILSAEFTERSYYSPDPRADFSCGDPLLERIWRLGHDTLRGCAEDALIDNPTRERGQWTGDVVDVAAHIITALHDDLRLIRRAVEQSAWCAEEDGLVAGLNPGGIGRLPTYSMQWATTALHLAEFTGERDLLENMHDYAQRNLDAVLPHLSDKGVVASMGWSFIDWGYVPESKDYDIAVVLHLLESIRSLRGWNAITGRMGTEPKLAELEAYVEAVVRRWLDAHFAREGDAAWSAIAYHCTVLALRSGFFAGERERQAVAAIKAHMLDCFPNNRNAPRLHNPQCNSRQLITPYFAFYAFPPLIERGEMDFVLDQIRACWGYALEGGRTTMIEVFDDKWTHCHVWASSPTWVLSHHVLGLRPFMLGERPAMKLALHVGTKLPGARGSVPIPLSGGALVHVEWRRDGDAIDYRLRAPFPIDLLLPDGATQRVDADWHARFKAEDVV